MKLKDRIYDIPSEKFAEPIKVSKKPLYTVLKRFFDIVFSLLGLLVLALPLALMSLIIVIDSPGASPIYAQDRVGKNGKVFKFYKFRSMVPGADKMLEELLDKNEMDGPAFKMKEDPRITRLGKFMRKTSIDELPQLWNVLKGDMSLVGPRPPLPREVEQYTGYQKQRLLVTPGITCYWQVQPRRNDLTFDEWLALDLKYITDRSLKNDFKILLATVGAVCGMEGE
ncbi:MAG: sugar transferase [Ruminococcaceae bacterium]|nr:sugar transferase [Oscillospiraceae bacterium]